MELITGPMVGGCLLNNVAVAHPVKKAAPQVEVDDRESPMASCNFSNTRVAVGFGGGAVTGSRADGLEVGGGKSSVKCDRGRVVGREEQGCGG